MTDDELMEAVQRARSDRDDAFRELVRRHAASVQGLVRAVLGRGEGVDDLTQEVFLRVYTARERYVAGRGELRAWLLRIARNLALNARRDRTRRRTGSLEEEPPSPGATPSRLLVRKLDLAALAAAVEKLPEGERELVRLRFREGLTYEEIGSMTGSGVAALKQKTWRALQRLRGLLAVADGA